MPEQDLTRLLLPLHYDGREVRTTIDNNGLIWWVAQDITYHLGYRDAAEAIRMVDDDERGTRIFSTLGGSQRMTTVNESGLYHLIFRSRKPEAKKFRRWVTETVLPTLRRTGTFAIDAPTIKGNSDQLPPPKPRVREHAEISLHRLAVWRVLRESDAPLDNRDIARLSGIGERTVRSHTRYLMQLGFLEVYETFPRHLYAIAENPNLPQTAYWQRLEKIRAIVEARHRLNYDDLRLMGKE
jgi:prophage antirepressor-like protein